MRIRILGPVSVTQAGKRLHLGSAKARALLATLLLAPNQRASHDEICAHLWPDGSGNGARIRTLIKDLRAHLPGLLPERNERMRCGLRIDRDAVDYFRFGDAVSLARSQSAEERVTTLRKALDEWRGEPLGELGDANLDEERRRLTAEWLDATVDYLNSLLVTGDRSRFATEMSTALRRWPASERLCVVQMSAMSKKPAKVAEFFARWKREHGQPSNRLVSEYERLVRRKALAPPTVPRELPQQRPDLFGRDTELAMLSHYLLPNSQSVSRTVVINGMPGSGKTQLALYWARSNEAAFPDGTLYVDLNGFASQDTPDPPVQVLPRLLNVLGVQPSAKTMDGMVTTYRSALAARKVLVVLDNARDAHQVRPLLPGLGPSAALVTSRDRLEHLLARERAHEIRLGPLSHADAVTMLQMDLGTARIRLGAVHLDEIATSCGDLPLALTVVAARARARRNEPLGEIAAALRAETTRLNSLSYLDVELNVRAALNSSYDSLSRGAADLFMLLAIHPGPTISRPALAALNGGYPESAVNELLASNLLDEPTFERFAYHDLVRLHASELAEQTSSHFRRSAADRIFGYLIDNSWACDQVLAPGRAVPVGSPNDWPVVAPGTTADAMAWLDSEYATIATAIRSGHRSGWHRYTWLLAVILVTYQWRSNRYSDAVQYLGYAAQAAERVAGLADQAMVYRMLAGSRRGLGELRPAQADLRRAITLSERAGDTLGAAHGQHNLGLVHRECAEPQAAARLFKAALTRYRQLDDQLGEAATLSGLGKVWYDLGDYDRALRHTRDALRVFEKTRDANGEASALVSLGRILSARHDEHQAISILSDAAARYAGLCYPRREATALVELADALCATNRFDDARSKLQRAVELLSDIDQQAAAAVKGRLAACCG